MDEKSRNEIENLVPMKAWLSLKEACELKGLNYKTSCNKTRLQPNMSRPDGKIGGKKMWLRTTVIGWLQLSDDDIEGRSR